jgi:uncharacterized tellurite resistance protein B-like protein
MLVKKMTASDNSEMTERVRMKLLCHDLYLMQEARLPKLCAATYLIRFHGIRSSTAAIPHFPVTPAKVRPPPTNIAMSI